MDTHEEIRRIVHQWIERGWQKGDVTAIDEFHDPDFTDHDSAGRPPDNEGFKEGLVSLYRAFPDLSAKIDQLVINAECGTAAVRWSAIGTHKKSYLGAEPTNKSISFKGIEILIIRNGKITDRWGEWDGLDLLVQLGRLEL